MQIKKLTKKLIQKSFKGLFLILVTITLAIFMQVFLFANFKISTPSMAPTIVPGDLVFVNKLLIGPRIYQNLDFLKGGKSPVKRLRGFRQIQRNDVFVFNFPYSDWDKLDFDLNAFYVKRCVAIPGDTFYIENGIYRVKNSPDTLGSYENQLQFAGINKEEVSRPVWNCFPNDPTCGWNVRQFGPLYVPRKGDMLPVDTNSIKLYRNLIRYETGKDVRVQGDSVFLDNALLYSYVFEKNYYFMAGDYVFDSQDSRYWGLLPEDHIVGKVAFVWKSEDPQTGKFRWNRFFKAIT